MNGKLSDLFGGGMGRSTSLGKSGRVSLDSARSLPQAQDIWECAVRVARVWVTPADEPPYRPYTILTASRTGMVVGVDIAEGAPTAAQVVNALVKAMRYPAPGAGRRRRPAAVYVDDESLVAALRPHLAGVGIRCEFRHTLREADRALRSFDRHMAEERIPGLLEGRGVTAPMAEAFFEAAAFFYREAPWRWIADSQPIEVRYPVDSQPRYAVVMGQGGVAYGLAIYDSKEILHETYARDPEEETPAEEAWTVLLFGDAVDMPFDDLDAIDAFGWPIAGPDAYPLVLRAGKSDRPDRPSKSHLLRMEAALRTLPRFVRKDMQADGCLPRAADTTYAMATANGEDRISLKYPVEGFEMLVEESWLAAADVEWIQKRGGELFGVFEHWLRDQGLAPRTIEKHMRNVGRFAIHYLFCEGGSVGSPCPLDEAAPADVDEFLADWLPYEGYGSTVAAVKSHIASLKKLYRCLRETGEMSVEEADEIIELLREDRAYYIDLAQEFDEDAVDD